MAYLMARWREDAAGSFALGLRHGIDCVGCCWALMLTGFAMGLMNLLWMAFLTVLLAIQKLVPHGDKISNAGAAAMLAWGAYFLI